MRRPIPYLSLVAAFVVSQTCCSLNSSAQDGGTPAADVSESTPPLLTLARVMEIRAASIGKNQNEDDAFMMSSETPGLVLTFSLRLPSGVKVMEVHQPTKVVAADSEGTDLAKVEPRFGDEIEYVDLEHDFKDDDDTSEITLHLAPAARKAMTFDAATAFEIMVYTGVKSVPLEVGKEWSPLPAGAVPEGTNARIRLTEDGFAIEPASLESTIDKLEVRTGPNEVVDSNGWFSDGSVITYMFDDVPAQGPVKATITVRTGMKAVPLTVELKGQPLP